MEAKQQTPGTRSEHAGANFQSSESIDKGIENLPRIQRKVAYLLNDGGRYSAADISIRLNLSDPRGHIAKLRRKGLPIPDEWCIGEYGTKYKRYFIHN